MPVRGYAFGHAGYRTKSDGKKLGDRTTISGTLEDIASFFSQSIINEIRKIGDG